MGSDDERVRPATGVAPDGRPCVGPFDRSGWRAWLIDNHASSPGTYLASWRRGASRPGLPYEDAVEEALCVGWIDSVNKTLDDELGIQWFSPRRRGSGWASTNKARVERLTAAGLMLPAGLAVVEAAKRDGSWSLLDDVEALIVPDDLARALDATPPARAHWEAFNRSARQQMLYWLIQAKRPETRARRVEAIASRAQRGEKALG